MFGTSGVRGPVGEEITAKLALAIGRAVAIDAERVVLGRDARKSGVVLADAFAAGCRESGTDVIDLGLAATPTVARAVRWEDGDAGASITASHNPPADNGIKLWQQSGQAFDAERRATVAERVREESADLVAWDELGGRTRTDATGRHVDAIVDAVDPPADPPAVVVDLGNGVGGVTVDALDRLGCAVRTLNAQPDGAFPGRPSEPTAEHLAALSATVAGTDATLGLAHDGDADRLQAVTGEGTYVGGDALLAIFAREAATPGERVAVPVDTSLAVADYLTEVDVGVTYTPVGDVHVAAACDGPDVAFGGEPSGAWIFPARTRCPDGPLAAATLVALHAERALAARVEDLPSHPIRRESVEVGDKAAVMDRVRALVGDRFEDVRTLDGVRVETDGGWFLVRASGTQPLVRITAQAREEDPVAALYETAASILAEARESTSASETDEGE
jgi:phosphoglucosamine mutase